MEQMRRLAAFSEALVCESETCEFRKVCAQHYTAGDFRSEDGDTPNIISINDLYFCNQTITDHPRGLILIKDHQLLTYQEVYSY